MKYTNQELQHELENLLPIYYQLRESAHACPDDRQIAQLRTRMGMKIAAIRQEIEAPVNE
jgi:hypothetical protein